MVINQNIKPKKAAAIVGIGYENGKAILKIFRREGRITNNKIKEQPKATKLISKGKTYPKKSIIPVLKPTLNLKWAKNEQYQYFQILHFVNNL